MTAPRSPLFFIAETIDLQSDGSSEYGFCLDQQIDAALEIEPNTTRDAIRWAIFAWETAIRMSPACVECRDDVESVVLIRDEYEEIASEVMFTVRQLPVTLVVPLDATRLIDPPDDIADLESLINSAKASVRVSAALIQEAVDDAVVGVSRALGLAIR
jgi:hypothetical protein